MNKTNIAKISNIYRHNIDCQLQWNVQKQNKHFISQTQGHWNAIWQESSKYIVKVANKYIFKREIKSYHQTTSTSIETINWLSRFQMNDEWLVILVLHLFLLIILNNKKSVGIRSKKEGTCLTCFSVIQCMFWCITFSVTSSLNYVNNGIFTPSP